MRRSLAVLTIVVLVGSFISVIAGPAVAATTFTVNQTGDGNDFNTADGVCDVSSILPGSQCSFRAAIQQANATKGVDTIAFAIGGGGGQTIAPASALPTITEAVTIDATTQPMFSGTPLITLLGSSAGAGVNGLTIGATSTTVKGFIIQTFGGNGISITAGGADTIRGNWIGINAGAAAAANSSNGILVGGTGGTMIGGPSSGDGNVISGNGVNGVEILATAPGYTIQGNQIGLNPTGSAAVGNSLWGVFLLGGSGIVGGSGVANGIGGNGDGGILIQGSGATSVDVLGNAIGRTMALRNLGPGVSIIDAPGNTIGGRDLYDSNTIGFNAGQGVSVVESAPGLAANNVILGNYIGFDGSTMPNTGDGVFVGANNTTLGGLPGGFGIGDFGNVISGNTGDGVHIGLGVTGAKVIGNFVGVDLSGTGAVPNGTGIEVQGSSNTIGGTAAGAGNVISGNAGTGLQIDGNVSFPLPTLNLVQGNRIGTTADGTAALPNLQGVLITDATKNTVGGTTGTTPGGACTGACNVISGNTGRGIDISNADTTGNIVAGNFIGTDPTGTIIAGLGNGFPGGGPGIRVETSASGTVIGGTKTSARNVISGNVGEGIDLEGALKTKVQGNYIGTDTTGTVDLGNGEVLVAKHPGVAVVGGSGNAIGGKGGSKNLISGNGDAGVEIDGTAKSTKVQGNLIGTKANGTSALGNGADGIDILDGTKSTIGGTTAGFGNTIWFNGGAGVSVTTGTGNAIRQNSIWSNGGLGIDLDPAGVNANDNKDPDPGPNLRQNFPIVTSAASGGGSIVISGTFNSTVNATNFSLEFFSSPACDASGNGEGKVFLGPLAAVATDANGNATWAVTLPLTVAPGSAITATATDSKADTSEFSACRTST